MKLFYLLPLKCKVKINFFFFVFQTLPFYQKIFLSHYFHHPAVPIVVIFESTYNCRLFHFLFFSGIKNSLLVGGGCDVLVNDHLLHSLESLFVIHWSFSFFFSLSPAIIIYSKRIESSSSLNPPFTNPICVSNILLFCHCHNNSNARGIIFFLGHFFHVNQFSSLRLWSVCSIYLKEK